MQQLICAYGAQQPDDATAEVVDRQIFLGDEYHPMQPIASGEGCDPHPSQERRKEGLISHLACAKSR